MDLLSYKAQLLLLLFNDQRFVKFKTQDIYNNKICFKRVIKQLLSTRWIRLRPFRANEYYLTVYGETVVGSIKKISNC